MEFQTNDYFKTIVTILFSVIVVAVVMIPIITEVTQTTTTTNIENDGAGWLRLGYEEGGDFDFDVSSDGSTLTVGDQSGTYSDMICYADADRTIFVSGENICMLTNGETPAIHKFTDTASVSNTSGTLTINDGSNIVYSGISPSWAYVPDANGDYGFFTEGGLNLEEGLPQVAVGSFAQIFAYNESVVTPEGAGNLDFVMDGNYADDDVVWAVATEETDANEEVTL